MSFSFQRTYLLEQQTPLIHFQYDQEGATLRATEVKPKLDKYILNSYSAKAGKKPPAEWFVGGKGAQVEHCALAYRIFIQTPPSSSECCPTISNEHEYAIQNRLHQPLPRRIEINKMYFANMVGSRDENGRPLTDEEYVDKVREQYKETVFFKSPAAIRLTVVCTNSDLMEWIDSSIEAFFALHNFGTRQTKGFGGFKVTAFLDDTEQRRLSDPIKMISDSGIPYFYFCTRNGSSDEKMNLASAVYAVMKGGINRRYRYNRTLRAMELADEGAYVKGYIQRQYLDDLEEAHAANSEQRIGSEKAKIKAEVLRLPGESRYSRYQFVRALLGIPDHYEFRNLTRNGTVNVYSLGNDSFDIQRFHSPITIKVIDNYVFFLFGSAKNILNKTFYLYFGQPRGITYDEKKADIMRNGKSIQTPSSIDWPFFIEHFIQYFNMERAKTNTGMIKCGSPFVEARALVLQNGCEKA